MKFKNFLQGFKSGKQVYIEDSIMWYCLDFDTELYLEFSIHERINFKQTYLTIMYVMIKTNRIKK